VLYEICPFTNHTFSSNRKEPFRYEKGRFTRPFSGAVNMPMDLGDRGDLSGGRLQAFRNALGEEKGRPIIIYCRDFR